MNEIPNTKRARIIAVVLRLISELAGGDEKMLATNAQCRSVLEGGGSIIGVTT